MQDFFIGIELTRHCNLHCSHCFRADLNKFSEIDHRVVVSILEQAKRYQKPHIALTGGEASLHTRFTDILSDIVAHGYSFHFVTNGFQPQALFEKVRPFHTNPLWTGISVSLDGATPESHDAIRGKWSFERALLTIAMARSLGKEVVVQMVIHRGNVGDMDAMAQLCTQLGVDRLHMAHMQPTPEAVKAGMLHSPEEFRQVEEKVSELAATYRLPVIMSAGFYDQTPLAHCRFLKLGALNIDYRGRLTTCCQLSNYEGAVGEEDVIADLKHTPLAQAHADLLDTYQRMMTARLKRMGNGQFSDLDHFHCWSCQKGSGKVEWMREHPDNPWVKQDPYFKELPNAPRKVARVQ